MSRTVAVVWHALFSIAAGILYFFFVLPRWPELVGDTSHTLGTVLRIVTGALIGLAALPVVFTLLRTRRPELATPRLALTLRVWSIALHVLAGALIIGTAISEIWLSLDSAGRWLFGIYGAAAAVFLLGVFSFYIAFIAELPPPPPRPLKTKSTKRRGRKGKGKVDDGPEASEEESPEEKEEPEKEEEATAEEEPTPDAEPTEKEPAEVTVSEKATEDGTAEEKTALLTSEADATSEDEAPAEDEPTPGETEQAEKAAEAKTDGPADAASTDGEEETKNGASRGLLNRRPSGKTGSSRRRRRLRGGVAVED